MTRVLVVDDDPAIRRTLLANLEARGYEVQVAADGRTALTLAADRRPDVVLLDLGLPDINGISVVQGRRGWTDVPIVILPAHIWSSPAEIDTSLMRVHMAHIRRKLEPDPARPSYFRTDPHLGYRFTTGYR